MQPHDYLMHMDELPDDTLAHYGVKGMKWGVRRKIAKQARYNDRQANLKARAKTLTGQTRRDSRSTRIGTAAALGSFGVMGGVSRRNGDTPSTSTLIGQGVASSALGLGVMAASNRIASARAAKRKYMADVETKGQKKVDNELLRQYNARKKRK